jgi:uncharacterized membrane protein YfcA
VSAAQVVLTAAVVALAAGIQTVTGFGFALVAVPALSLFIPTETAVVLSASLGLISSTGQAVSERHHGDRRTIRWMLGAAVLGAPFGLLVLLVATERQLRIALVTVIVVFLVVNLREITVTRASRGVDFVAGAVSGLLNTALSTNGPPLVMALHPRRLAPPVFRGTLTAVLAGSGVVTVGLFAASGRYDLDVAVLFLAALPGMALGFGLGLRHRHRIGTQRFRQVVITLLAATAAVAVVGLLTS